MHRTLSRHTAKPGRASVSLLACMALACALILSACGGSGSSGFDLAAAENAAIDRALDSQRCQMEDGLTICASGGTNAPTANATATPTPTNSSPIDLGTPTSTPPNVTGTPTPSGTPPVFPSASATRTTTRPPASPTPTPTATSLPAQPGIDTNVMVSDAIPCVAPPSAPCTFVFTFTPSGLPAGAQYWVAVRTRNPNGIWRLIPAVDNSAVITIDADGPMIQVAVLVFVSDPGPLPEQVEILADSGADYAFVTPVLTPQSASGASTR